MRQVVVLDFPFSDPDLCLSVDYLLREEGRNLELCERDEYPIGFPMDRRWLSRTLTAGIVSIRERSDRALVRLMEDYQAYIDEQNLTEELWVHRFEHAVRSIHELVTYIDVRYRTFVLETFNPRRGNMILIDCSAKPQSDVLLLYTENLLCQNHSSISTMRRR